MNVLSLTRCYSILLFCFLISLPAIGRQSSTRPLIGISAGMGVSANSAPSIVDYVNAVAQPPFDQRADEFSAATEFFVVPEYQISDEWSIAVDYSYHLKSYGFDSQSGAGRMEFTHSVHMPMVVVHYLIPGQGYWLKVGGGVGYHVGSFTESFLGVGQETTLRATGFGTKLEAVGNTVFDDHFYGSIGLDLRWVFGSTFKTPSGQTKSYLNFTPQMSFFSVGLKFGVMVLF